MGIFSQEPEVPDTIGGVADKLQKAAAKQDWFSKEAVDRRIQSTEQQQKRNLS